MKLPARYVVAGILLLFAWKGATIDLLWPPEGMTDPVFPRPAPALLEWAAPMRPIIVKMTPKDRDYVARFYSAVAIILVRDGDSKAPLITDTSKFEAFHAGSLRLAIDRKDVGKYEGLGEAIDQVFMSAVGPAVSPVDDDVRKRLVIACNVIASVLRINGE